MFLSTTKFFASSRELLKIPLITKFSTSYFHRTHVKYLCEERKEYILSKQLLRSGTSIGANIAEAFYGQSEADFVSKLSIAQKETGETMYWLELLHESEYLKQNEYDSIYSDAEELI